MKKIKNILFLLLCCGILACGVGKVNVKTATTNNKAASEEEKRLERLKELRTEAKLLFPDIIEYDKINPKHFEKTRDYVFLMRFSNIIIKPEDKMVKLPIFRGTMGDVQYSDFKEYCNAKGLMKRGIIETGFEVEFKKGEYDKVLEEFKKFYGSRLSIDFKKDPSGFIPYTEAKGILSYAFTLDGFDGELSFHYPYNEKDRNEETKLVYSM